VGRPLDARILGVLVSRVSHAVLARLLPLGLDGRFAPPAPFGLEELDPAGRLPARAYTRAELQAYLVHGRQKCQATITSISDEQLGRLCRVGQGELTFAELLLYTMRHVQEHAAQLNMFLGQRTGSAARWVGGARDS
jgi:hypothetical protein